VDVVMECRRRQLVGVEVKAGADGQPVDGGVIVEAEDEQDARACQERPGSSFDMKEVLLHIE